MCVCLGVCMSKYVNNFVQRRISISFKRKRAVSFAFCATNHQLYLASLSLAVDFPPPDTRYIATTHTALQKGGGGRAESMVQGQGQEEGGSGWSNSYTSSIHPSNNKRPAKATAPTSTHPSHPSSQPSVSSGHFFALQVPNALEENNYTFSVGLVDSFLIIFSVD